jgi:hypothetical protein
VTGHKDWFEVTSRKRRGESGSYYDSGFPFRGRGQVRGIIYMYTECGAVGGGWRSMSDG